MARGVRISLKACEYQRSYHTCCSLRTGDLAQPPRHGSGTYVFAEYDTIWPSMWGPINCREDMREVCPYRLSPSDEETALMETEPWVCVDEENDVWVSVSERKYSGRGDPKEYRAHYCRICETEIPETSLVRRTFQLKTGRQRLVVGHMIGCGRFHPVRMTVQHPTCNVYACPICGAAANPSLGGYCSQQHREMMMRRLLKVAGMEVIV